MTQARPQSALLTGFPRLLTRSLALRLLDLHPESRVTLLVREADRVEADRFRRSVEQARSDAHTARMEFAIGHPGDVDLGLPGRDIRRVLADTTVLFHTDHLQEGPRAELRMRNVGALQTLFELAREMPSLRRFCVFSTTFVSGSRTGVIREEELACGQQFRTPYERCLFDAEQIAREMMPWMPVTVFRPGSMIGYSGMGADEGITRGPSYLVRLLVSLPAEIPLLLPAGGVMPFNIVPMDYVAHAACHIANRPEGVGRTFHLTDPNPLSARRAFEILSEVAHRPAPVSAPLALRLMRRVMSLPGIERLAREHLSLLENLNTHVVYSCPGTLELLRGSGIVCPPFESYADDLVVWVKTQVRAARVSEITPAFQASDV